MEGAGVQGSRAEEREGPSHALGISLGGSQPWAGKGAVPRVSD